ncbi:mechanosensitive ion channel family protein [Acuticoccus sp. MNP-M23]|uniref:mechanosensitive ion channel family protein n=1 Tax=Acuticoccus sp. MNP-M23 TaxID=3072793 RepID=UPI002814EB93|nr:mechanosensitive ion channel family protein [Acuticoccus sp. MNP-M23]WMS42221.1 mechanosensitive ion channel family protein [Acuticoccus sp. MNP-M23]
MWPLAFLRCAAIWVALALGCTGSLAAGGSDTAAAAAPTTPQATAAELAPLSSQERAALIGRMTDAQSRDLLLYYLSQNAPAAAASAQGHAAALSMKVLQETGTALRVNLEAVLSKFGQLIGDYVGKMEEKLRVSVGAGGILYIVGTLLGLTLVGGLLELGYRYATRTMVARYESAPIETVRQKMTRALGQLVHGLGAIAVFAAGFIGTFLAVWQGDVPRRDFLIVVLLAIVVTRVTVALIRFVFLPNHTGWRIMPADDEAAAHFVRGTRRQVTLGIVLLLIGTLGRMWEVENDVWRLGSLLGAIVFALSYGLFLWRYRRHALRTVEAAVEGINAPRWASGAAGWTWYALAVTYVIVATLLGIYALLLGNTYDPLRAAAGFLVLFVLNPYATAVCKALFLSDNIIAAPARPSQIFVTDPDDGERVAMNLSSAPAEDGDATTRAPDPEVSMALRDKRVLSRVISTVVLIASLALFATVIGVDVFSSTNEYPIAQFVLGILIDIGVVGLLGYVIWALIASWIDKKLAEERAKAPVEEEESEGPSANAGTRLQTILPLLRRTIQIVIAVMAVLVGLAAMGVNIAPLIAGAGVFGLAVGFGAQTLVKDIISGLFFLMDDAFRIGEYIETGGTAGTVERFNARSLVLRGYLGAVYTVPYGSLGMVTNFSRDWVMMKLRFRVPYDTDIDKVRKLFKKIGQEMQADPELGPAFLQPFKSQGVVKMDDSAFIVSGKFMTKPNQQWAIRKAVYTKVQKAFADNGIKFAPKRVIVDVPHADNMDDHHDARQEQLARAGAAVSASEGKS